MVSSLLMVFCLLPSSPSLASQKVDVTRLTEAIRAAVAAQFPEFTFERGTARGPESEPRVIGRFSLSWADRRRAAGGSPDLHAWCVQYSSAEEAGRELRHKVSTLSVGTKRVADVADEAYGVDPRFGWLTYFARRQFVCMTRGRTEAFAHTLTDIVIRQIDSTGDGHPHF